MSMTAFGLTRPSYWSYMGAVMARCLGDFTKLGRIDPSEIPPAVYDDAKRFFSLALESAGDGLAEDPPASMNVYTIAVDVAHSMSPRSLAEVDNQLEAYARFLTTLQNARALKQEELTIASDLQRFFRKLVTEGEINRHNSSRRLEDPPGWSS